MMDLKDLIPDSSEENPTALIASILATLVALYQLEKKEDKRKNGLLVAVIVIQFVMLLSFLFVTK